MENYEELVGKLVVIEKTNGEVLNGTLEAANPGVGAVLKPKGKARTILLEWDEIQEISRKARGPKKLRQKHLKPIEITAVRDHLIDRHGYELEAIQALSDQEAAEFHDGLDHSTLGHDHARGQGNAGAESAASPDEVDDEDVEPTEEDLEATKWLTEYDEDGVTPVEVDTEGDHPEV